MFSCYKQGLEALSSLARAIGMACKSTYLKECIKKVSTFLDNKKWTLSYVSYVG